MTAGRLLLTWVLVVQDALMALQQAFENAISQCVER